MENDLSPELRQYLRRCGLSERRIAQCDGKTRMYHDLGLYGDIAEACLEELVDNYQVDLNGFEFNKFFPPEFAGKNTFLSALYSVLPFAGYVARHRIEYLPLTLQMMDKVMRTKRWRADEKLSLAKDI